MKMIDNSYKINEFSSGQYGQKYQVNDVSNRVNNASEYTNSNIDMGLKHRDSQNNSNANTLSWTNFIAMEFKTE